MKRLTSLFAAAVMAASAFASDKYPYPMNIPVSISASFAELRANHFHAGLDMSTQGVVGVEVHSVADGYVSRVKVSPYGYGYALYIDHPDGHTTVYGHLSAYAPKIDTLVLAEQYRRKSFDVDIRLKPGQIKVRKGEVVALSGNTGGSGGPHLHFEVRDTRTQDALNPMAFLVPIPDNQAPTPYGIKLYAHGDLSQVDGRCSDKYYALADIEGRTVDACGEIGVGIHAVDFLVAGHRPCGIVDIKLFDGNKLIFSSFLDRVAFDQTRYINSHVDFAERAQSKRFVQKSFVDPNNRLPIYRTSEPLVVADGERHEMRYELTDFNGNKRTVRFTVVGRRMPMAQPRMHTGYHVDWAKTWTLDTLDASVLVPREALYSSQYVDVSQTALADGRRAWVIGHDGIPMHKSMTVSLPLTPAERQLGSKVFVGAVNNKGVVSYLASTVDGTAISAKTKLMGTFVIAADTVPPKVLSRNTRTSLKPSNSVMIGLSDNLSGIKRYDVRIDGQWKCFEYDYKNARLISTVARLGLKAGRHTLEAVVDDECGNRTTWTWSFTVVAQ